jgi:hypothetical protein
MKLKRLLIVSFLMLIYSCGSSKSVEEVAADRELLKTMITKKEFIIRSNSAKPTVTGTLIRIVNSGLLPVGSSASNITLTSNQNYLKIKNDSVFIELPFFGERQMGGGYNNNEGFNYGGYYDSYKIVYNAKKKFYSIDLKVNNITEALDITIRLYENLNTTITVNSNQRTSMGYDGVVTKLVKEKE